MMRDRYARPPGAERRRGAAAVEFVLIGPLLLLLLFNLIVYAGWFWIAHSVQSLASEGARAALGGLDAVERESLARDLIDTEAGGLGLDARRAAVEVSSDAQGVRVRIRYDAASHPIMALAGLTYAPPMEIRRTAAVRLGGY